MEKVLARLVRREFDLLLRERNPEFTKVQKAEIPPGWCLYKSRNLGEFSCFILLAVDPARDWFTVECAWSQNGEFPAYSILRRPFDEPKNGALRFRLAGLWDGDTHDYWWELGPKVSPEEELMSALEGDETLSRERNQAKTLVQSSVLDAIENVEVYAIPYFQSRCISLEP